MTYDIDLAARVVRSTVRKGQGGPAHRQANNELLGALVKTLDGEGWEAGSEDRGGRTAVAVGFANSKTLVIENARDGSLVCTLGDGTAGTTNRVLPEGVDRLWFDHADGKVVGPDREDGLVFLVACILRYSANQGGPQKTF